MVSLMDGSVGQPERFNSALNILDSITDREENITSHIIKDNIRKSFVCNICNFGASSRHKVFCHIESIHYRDSTITYYCEFCNKTCSSRNALGSHMTREHKQQRMNF